MPFVLCAYKKDPKPGNVSELSFGVENACLSMPLSVAQSPRIRVRSGRASHLATVIR